MFTIIVPITSLKKKHDHRIPHASKKTLITCSFLHSHELHTTSVLSK